MEFISAKEFSNQPKEVQEVLMEWWKPQQYDLYLYDNKTLEITLRSDDDLILPIRSNSVWDEKARCIPLFTEGQLRKFIEDKMCGRIETIDYLSDGYDFYYYDEYNNQYCIGEELGDGLLQAYWKVACEIAKESVEGGL